jgi:Tol biopolymer transport system component
MAAILERQPPPISSLQALTPPALDHIVRTCLAKDPDARQQNAHDVMLELKWIAEGGSQAGVPALGGPHRRNREKLSWAFTSIAVVAALVLGFILFRRPTSDALPARFILQAPEGAVLADDQGTGGPAISPDGRLLALIASHAKSSANAEPLLWVRALDSLSAQPLSGTEGASYPFWSPDNRFIGFFAQGKLKKIDAAGRSVQTICEAGEGWGTSAWNQEGEILFNDGIILNRVSAAGGKPTPATALDPSRKESSHRWVQFLPDGRHFLYTAFIDGPPHSEDNALYVASLDSGKPAVSWSKDKKRLLSTDYKGAYASGTHGGTGHLLFWRGNSLMAQPFDPQKLELTGEPVPVADQSGGRDNGGQRRPFSISENGVLAYPSNLAATSFQMVWYDRAGKRLGTVGEPGEYMLPRLSPDQKQLAVERYANDFQNSAVWLFDLVRNTASRFTFSSGVNGVPIWSPDGSRIVFNSSREKGILDLYQKATSGAGSEEQILTAGSNVLMPDWSRDGRFIAYEVGTPKSVIWVLPLAGDRKPFPFTEAGFNQGQPAFSPDGRWLAYASDESGKNEVYVRTFTGRPGAVASG